jgi:hypothetical protein
MAFGLSGGYSQWLAEPTAATRTDCDDMIAHARHPLNACDAYEGRV